MPKALVVGAGNIGRGFLAEILTESGITPVFCDVNEVIISVLKTRQSYQIQYLGTGEAKEISGFAAILSTNEAEYQQAVAECDLIMTAMGVNLLPKISKQLAAALNKTPKKRVVMACENAIRATSIWKKDLIQYLNEEAIQNTLFVDVAVDRIVPAVRLKNGDVGVEPYKELVAEKTLMKSGLVLKEVRLVENLDSFIERKLFCVNATHAYIAWQGIQKGYEFIHESLNDQEIEGNAQKLLSEISAILIAKYAFDKTEMDKYCLKTIDRFKNAALMDGVARVGRGVIRKVSRNERLVAPIFEAIKFKKPHEELLKALKLGFSVNVPDDKECERLRQEIAAKGKKNVIEQYTGLPPEIIAKIV